MTPNLNSPAPTPALFIQQVQQAHAVFTAYRAGAHFLPELCKRTGLQPGTVRQWCEIFNLPLRGSFQKQRLLREHPTELYLVREVSLADITAPIDRT